MERNPVSILVLLEKLLEESVSEYLQDLGIRFQSLFFWKSYWKISKQGLMSVCGCVSILVLLEKLLEVSLLPGIERFQGVSILVLLEKLLEEGKAFFHLLGR